MNKKEYMTPAMETIKIQNVQILSGSGVGAVMDDASLDVLFGGVDVDGLLDPAASDMPDLDSMFE